LINRKIRFEVVKEFLFETTNVVVLSIYESLLDKMQAADGTISTDVDVEE
jgi:hypothetical protein